MDGGVGDAFLEPKGHWFDFQMRGATTLIYTRRKTEEPENRDAFSYVKFLLVRVNDSIQILLTLLGLIKPNLT